MAGVEDGVEGVESAELKSSLLSTDCLISCRNFFLGIRQVGILNGASGGGLALALRGGIGTPGWWVGGGVRMGGGWCVVVGRVWG